MKKQTRIILGNLDYSTNNAFGQVNKFTSDCSDMEGEISDKCTFLYVETSMTQKVKSPTM